MKKLLLTCFITALFTSFAFANDDEDLGGELNPDEMSLNKSLEKALRGEVNMVICAQGYLMTKKGDHEKARKLMQECAKQGWTHSMTWMSYMEQNGFGTDENPKAAAEWDKKAAQIGDPIGMFNHGLDLLRGYGVEQNDELGRSYIDKAAKHGIKDAERLQQEGYDYEAVTPDADSWKYEKKIY